MSENMARIRALEAARAGLIKADLPVALHVISWSRFRVHFKSFPGNFMVIIRILAILITNVAFFGVVALTSL
jgi:hypothetical protein